MANGKPLINQILSQARINVYDFKALLAQGIFFLNSVCKLI